MYCSVHCMYLTKLTISKVLQYKKVLTMRTSAYDFYCSCPQFLTLNSIIFNEVKLNTWFKFELYYI
jgi:hypothetical protein